MSPLEYYSYLINQGNFQSDPSQYDAIQVLNTVFHQIMKNHHHHQKALSRIMYKIRAIRKPMIKGVYMWGGVGRGKTWLLGIMHYTLPKESTIRIHFHQFMQMIHNEMQILHQADNPINKIIARLAKQISVLCLDEFIVTDIGDAMILYHVLRALIKNRIVLITTSNAKPKDLYKDGLQRSRFIPAIQLIEQYNHVVAIDSEVDYRCKDGITPTLYYYPLGMQSATALQKKFDQLTLNHHIEREPVLTIQGRSIKAQLSSGTIVWFQFEVICSAPRSVHDYIELVDLFNVWIVENVPTFTKCNENKAKRFIHLVDECYEKKVVLIISAEVAIENLYQGDKLEFEFHRTKSRLLQMQTKSYYSALNIH